MPDNLGHRSNYSMLSEGDNVEERHGSEVSLTEPQSIFNSCSLCRTGPGPSRSNPAGGHIDGVVRGGVTVERCDERRLLPVGDGTVKEASSGLVRS